MKIMSYSYKLLFCILLLLTINSLKAIEGLRKYFSVKVIKASVEGYFWCLLVSWFEVGFSGFPGFGDFDEHGGD